MFVSEPVYTSVVSDPAISTIIPEHIWNSLPEEHKVEIAELMYRYVILVISNVLENYKP